MARRNDYDVTDRVNTTDPVSVNDEVNRIFLELYPNTSTHVSQSLLPRFDAPAGREIIPVITPATPDTTTCSIRSMSRWRWRA